MPRASTKSAAEKRHDGTVRGKKKAETPPKPPVKFEIIAPAWLDPVASEWFMSQGELLKKQGTLNETDLTVLAFTAKAFSSVLKLQGKIDSLDDPKKEFMLERLIGQKMKTFLDLSKSLGSTSVDRGKVKPGDQGEENPFARFTN